MALVSLGEKLWCLGVYISAPELMIMSQKNFQLVAGPITIGADVWVCAEAFVGPGLDRSWCCDRYDRW